MKRILVICHGNIFRSPTCAAVLQKELPADRFEVRSAGTTGSPARAAKGARDYAAAQGYDLEQHRAQPVTPELLIWADLVLYMDAANLRNLRILLQAQVPDEQQPELRNLGSYVNRNRIPDPAFMPRASREFAEVMELILAASRQVVAELVAEPDE